MYSLVCPALQDTRCKFRINLHCLGTHLERLFISTDYHAIHKYRLALLIGQFELFVYVMNTADRFKNEHYYLSNNGHISTAGAIMKLSSLITKLVEIKNMLLGSRVASAKRALAHGASA